MVNPFLSSTNYDTETAVMLEQAYIHDIGNAVAYTDGTNIFLNTQDKLFKILPAFNDGMLKWLLWHERMHLELKHHARFFKYLKELDMLGLSDEFAVTKNEVNIIMDILVHDWMGSKFPELVETALNNLAQFRDRNSLGYTFKTFTLEEMLEEYRRHKHPEDTDKDTGSSDEESEETEDSKEDTEGGKSTPLDEPKKDADDKEKEDKEEDTKKSHKGHASGGHAEEEPKGETPSEDGKPEDMDESEQPPEPEPAGHHDETDWSKLDDIDSKEFITASESNDYMREINRLKQTKIRLAKISKTLNGLVTTTKTRTYKTPSYMQTGQHTIMKGRQNGKSALYLCFDASGSMSGEMDMFKEIITKAIPQAMNCPCEWFAGWAREKTIDPYKTSTDDYGYSNRYYKGVFKDFICFQANNGFCDDGDRVIELCHQAEKLGYSPIGVTDGGGRLSWSKDMLKELKRTVLIGHNGSWLKLCQEYNPNIQIIDIEGGE